MAIHKLTPRKAATAGPGKYEDGGDLPDEATLAAFAAELRGSRRGGGLCKVGRRLNYEDNQYRGLLMRTLRGLPASSNNWTQTLSDIDPAWGETAT